MKLALLIVASVAVYVVLGTLVAGAVAPLGFYLGELEGWLEDRISEDAAVIVSAIIGIHALIAVGIAVIYATIVLPKRLSARYGRRHEGGQL